MLSYTRKKQVALILRTLIWCSTLLVLTSACVVIEKETSHKLISGEVKVASNKYNFKRVSRFGRERVHIKRGEWMFYSDTGSSTFAYNARKREISIVAWPEKIDFEYVQKSGTIEQSDGKIFPLMIINYGGSSGDTFYLNLIRWLGRSDQEPSFGGIFELRSSGEGYTGYPDDSHPVSIYFPYKLNGVEHEVYLTTQKHVRRKLGLSDLTFTGNP